MNGARHNNFDAVRLAAALAVLLSHQHALTGLPEPSFGGIHSAGSLAVAVFFSISGFLVAASWQHDPSVLRFAARRALRIWPALVVVVALSAFVAGPLHSSLAPADYFRDGDFWKYFRNLRMLSVDELPGVRFEGSALPTAINGSLWTIPLEVKCYVALALLAVVARRWWGTAAVAATALLAIAFFFANSRGELLESALGLKEKSRLLLEFGLYFGAGVALQRFAVDTRPARAKQLVLGTAAIAAAAAWAAGQRVLAVWLVVPVLVILAGTASTPFLRRAGRWGDLSYGTYLYAFPVQQLAISSLGNRLPWLAVFAITVAATLACAFASWHLVEKTTLRWKPRRQAPAEAPGSVMRQA